MATIDGSNLIGSFSIGDDDISLLPSVYFDESSLEYTSRSISGSAYVVFDNEEYWANISIYGKFKYGSVSSLERSKITSINFSVDGLGRHKPSLVEFFTESYLFNYIVDNS